MSLFSPRNFLSPLTNTVNVVAIILVVFLFAIFRFSMGRYQVVPATARVPAVHVQPPSKLDDLQALLSKKSSAPQPPQLPPSRPEEPVPPQHAEADKPVQAPGRQGLNLMKEMESLDKGTAKQKPASTATEDNLSDVEKALGLR